MEYCLIAEYTPSAIASSAETRIPQKISWTVNHMARWTMDFTESFGALAVAEVAVRSVAEPPPNWVVTRLVEAGSSHGSATPR